MSSVPTIPDPSDPGAAPTTAPAIGVGRRYEPGGIVGRGGMGEVWLARDTWLGRDVALKRARAHDVEAARRLAREAALTAELEHPNIIPVYEAGRDEDGRPFYTMRLLTGRSLADVLSARELTRPDRHALVRHVLGAAEAIAHAHGRGIIHRDLKPANVMVGALGETVVADWGLACRVEDAQAGRLGTPGYIPPEQAAGERVGTAADVYGLGAILFEVLVGRPPPTTGPAPRVQGTPDVAPELAAIADRALSAAISDRYPSARAMADDLLAWFEGRRVAAHAYTPGELARRFVSAYRLPLVVGGVAAVLLAAAVGVGWAKTAEERRRALESEAEARRAEAEVQRAFAEALVAEGRSAAAAERWMEAEILAVNALVREESAAARGLLARVAGPRAALLRRQEIADCEGGSLTADGTRMVCIDATSVRILDVSVSPPTIAARLEGNYTVAEPAGHDGVLLAAPKGAISFWSPPDVPFELPASRIVPGTVHAAVAPGQFLFQTGRVPLLVEPRLRSGALTPICEEGAVRGLSARDDGTVFAGCVDRLVVRRDATGVHPFTTMGVDEGDVSSIVALPDGRVVVGTYRGAIVLFEGDGRRLARVFVSSEEIDAMLAREGRLVTRSVAMSVQVWELPPATASDQTLGPPLLSLRARGKIALIDRETLRIGRADGTSQLLEDRHIPSARRVTRLSIDGGGSGVAWSDDGLLAVVAGTGAVQIFDATTGALLRASACSAAVAKDVTWVGGRAAVATMSEAPCLIGLEGPPTPFYTGRLRRVVTVSPTELLVLPYNGEGAVVTPGSGKIEPIGRTRLGDAEVVSGEIAVADDDDVVWRGRDPRALHRAGAMTGTRAIAPLGDGTVVASTTTLVRLDAAGREVARVTADLTNEILTSPDFRWIAVGKYDGRIEIWPADLSAPVAVFTGHRARVGGFAFSPDGSRLASVSWDGEVRLWSMGDLTTPADELRQRAEADWGRGLSEILDADSRESSAL